jgi:DHA2 family multidrug resistance protein
MPDDPAPAALPVRDSYRWQVLIVVMIATLMAGLDSSIVNIALPDMMAGFGTTVDNIEWVVTGYMLGYAVFIPMASWFKERLGSRRVFLGAVAVFTVGSGLCGLSWNLPSIIAARVFQAAGGGFITALAMSMVAEVFPPAERGKAIGLWAMGVILGPALGPTLGGYLTLHLGWRSIFMVNLPIGLLTVVLGAALLREGGEAHPSQHKPFDAWGCLFFSLFLVSILLGLSQGEEKGWHSAYIITCWILGSLGFLFFLMVEAAQPPGVGLVDLSLFKSPVFTSCILVTVGRPIGLFGATFLLPLFMQNLMGRDELQSGLMLLPGSLLLALLMPAAGRLSDAMGPRWLVLIGSLGMGYFMVAYVGLDATSSDWALIWPQLIRAFAISLMVAPVMAAALNSAPTHKSAQVSSLLNLTQQVFGSLGIAVLASYMDHRQHFHMLHLAGGMAPDAPAVLGQLRPVAWRALELGYSHADARVLGFGVLARNLGRAAAVRAFDDTFLFGAILVTAACVAPALMLPSRTVGHGKHEEPVILE